MKEENYWFYAKKPGYGYGWGLPANGKGWLSLSMFIVTLIGWSIVFDPDTYPIVFTIGFLVFTALFVGLCFVKGQVQQK